MVCRAARGDSDGIVLVRRGSPRSVSSFVFGGNASADHIGGTAGHLRLVFAHSVRPCLGAESICGRTSARPQCCVSEAGDHYAATHRRTRDCTDRDSQSELEGARACAGVARGPNSQGGSGGHKEEVAPPSVEERLESRIRFQRIHSHCNDAHASTVRLDALEQPPID